MARDPLVHYVARQSIIGSAIVVINCVVLKHNNLKTTIKGEIPDMVEFGISDCVDNGLECKVENNVWKSEELTFNKVKCIKNIVV